MGQARKYDEKVAEHEYVTSDITFRALALKLGVGFSTLAAKARKEDWAGKRMSYRAAMSRRSYETLAVAVADEESVIRTESVAVLRATLRRYAEQLQAGAVNVSTKDVVESVKTLALIMGDPEAGRGDDKLNAARDVTRPDADHLRRVAEVARRRVAAGSVLEGVAVSEPPRTRPN